MLATLEDLDEYVLKRILQEPKNALVKQYQRLFEMENVNLTFQDEEVLQPTGGNTNINPFQPSGFQALSGQFGVREQGWSGGQFELSQRAQRIYRDEGGSFGGVNPYHLSELLLRVTQPLLRDFGRDVNAAGCPLQRALTKVTAASA